MTRPCRTLNKASFKPITIVEVRLASETADSVLEPDQEVNATVARSNAKMIAKPTINRAEIFSPDIVSPLLSDDSDAFAGVDLIQDSYRPVFVTSLRHLAMCRNVSRAG